MNREGFSDPRDPGRELGERRKQLALDLLDANRADIVLLARRALLQTALCNGTATADDVRDCVELPPGIDPKLFGSVPGPLAKARIIKRVGFATTCRPMAHARPIAVWQLADRAKAIDWLRNNKPAAPTAIDATGNSNSTKQNGEIENDSQKSI